MQEQVEALIAPCARGMMRECDALIELAMLYYLDPKQDQSGPAYQSGATYQRQLGPLQDKLTARCDAGSFEGCLAAAYAITARHNDYDPYGVTIAPYVTHMTRACELGSDMACAELSAIYADGAYERHGAFSVATSAATLEQVLGPACEAGRSAVCWMLVEAFYFSLGRSFKRDLPRSVGWMVRGCEGLDPRQCLLGAAALMDWSMLDCQRHLSDAVRPLPTSLVIDEHSDGGDLLEFCELTRQEIPRDTQRAQTLLTRGCAMAEPSRIRDATCVMRDALRDGR